MKALTTKTTLAAVTLAAATFMAPMAAHAGSYDKCKDTENAVAGAAVGGSLGAVIGKEIAGRGDNTEGAILGALIGGTIGAAVGDGVNDCEKYNKRNRTYRTTPAVRNVGYHPGHNDRGYRNRGYRTTSYGHGHRNGHYDPLYNVDRRIEALRRERDYIKRSRHISRWEYRRLDQIGHELHRLKKERKRIKRASDRRRDYRDDYRPRRRGHYHGSNICYSNH